MRPRTPRLLLTLALALWGWSIQRSPYARGWAVQNVNLAIHETGHLVFAPFGEFMAVAGGSLFQLLVPLVFAGYFLRRRDAHAASVALWWEATNWWYVGVYIDDAQKLELPLVGGGEHDWVYLLSEFGKVHASEQIAARVHAVGTLVLVVATAAGIVTAMQPRPAEAPEAGLPA